MKRRTRDSTEPLPAEALDALPRVALVLTDETMYLTRFNARGGPVATYPVGANDVAGVFHGFGADTGLLPPDILFWQTRQGRVRIGLWLPPAVRALSFPRGRGHHVSKVPLPGFVFVGEGSQYRIFAAPSRPTKPADWLYHAPLPNVHDNGWICQGDVPFPKASLETLSQAAGLFFESHFTDHLSTDKVRSQLARPGDRDDDFEDEDDNGPYDGADTDAYGIAEGYHPARRHAPVSLVKFLGGLKRTFPLDELIPAITMQQLLSGGADDADP